MYLDNPSPSLLSKREEIQLVKPPPKNVNYNVPSELKAGFFSKGVKHLSGNELDFSVFDYG